MPARIPVRSATAFSGEVSEQGKLITRLRKIVVEILQIAIIGMRTTVLREKFTLMGTRALAILWYGRARVNATVARWLGC